MPIRHGVSYSDALMAAYAVAPEDEVIIDTLEFRHPAFVDENGDPTSVRVVNDHTPLFAGLDDASGTFRFEPVGFQFSRPAETSDSAPPEITVTVDNVSQILIPYLDQIKESRDLITVIWRPYLASDLSVPHMNPPLTLTATSVTATMASVTMKAGFASLVNRRFPSREYISKLFTSLVAR